MKKLSYSDGKEKADLAEMLSSPRHLLSLALNIALGRANKNASSLIDYDDDGFEAPIETLGGS